MNQADLAYAAGLFDGEGCVMIARRANTFYLYLRITSTDLPILEWFKVKFGGSVNLQPKNKNIKACRQAWYWVLCSISASKFLKEILPYLIVKKKQATLAIEFQSRVGEVGVNRLTPEEVQTRSSYRMKLSELKEEPCGPDEHLDIDIIYAAGILDGEGSVLIYNSNGYYQLAVRVTNTDHNLLSSLKEKFGGSVGSKIEKKSKRTRPCWQWDVQGPAAANFLKSVAPYLISKQPQAQLGIEFQSDKSDGEIFKRRISDLNRRRPDASSAALP